MLQSSEVSPQVGTFNPLDCNDEAWKTSSKHLYHMYLNMSRQNRFPILPELIKNVMKRLCPVPAVFKRGDVGAASKNVQRIRQVVCY